MKKLLAIIVLALAVLVSMKPLPVMAHEGIYTYKYIDGNNLVLLTHNVHDVIPDIPITYNARLYTLDGQPIAFEKLEVTVRVGDRQVHRETLSPSADNEVNFTYTYPHKENFILSVTFLDADKAIAHGEFPIELAAREDFFAGVFTLQTGLAFVTGSAVTAGVLTQRKRLLSLYKRFQK